MKIKHVNDSSLLLQSNEGNYLWCDPWIISTAFKTWVQNPKPSLQTVTDILNIDNDNINILVSHGHDDHLDEFVIKKHFNKTNVFIPKLRTPGVRNRITNLDCIPIEIGEEKYTCGGFEIINVINQDFTGDDTIFMISDDEHLVIHANDNYHHYNDTLLSQIKDRMSKFKKEKTFYFVQRGIADSYPWSYEYYHDREVSELVKERYKKYCETIETNRKNLGVDKVLLYANQAKITHDTKREDWLLSVHKEVTGDYVYRTQLYPDNIIKDNNIINYYFDNGNKTYYQKCFEKYEELVNGYLKAVTPKDIYFPVKFFDRLFDNYKCNQPIHHVEVSANPEVWNDIFSGKQTIEAITIGGAGTINKPLDYNLSTMFHSMTKICYRIQSIINKEGLNWINYEHR